MTGSTSFALQGVPVEPDDIDVRTTEAGARAAETLLSEAVTEPVERVESERIRSSLGAARVDGVTVELIGGVEKHHADGSWTEPPPIGELRRTVALGDRTRAGACWPTRPGPTTGSGGESGRRCSASTPSTRVILADTA